MEQFKEIVKQIYDGEINLGTIHAYFHDIFMKLLPFLIIYTIIFLISFYFILKKEGKKPWYAFIPFYNMYLYFKIIDLPFILFFIPILNVFTLILAPYNLAKEYSCKEWMRYLAVLFPYVIIPYIAFSNLQNRNKKIEFNYLKFGKDIDKLENELKVITDDNYVEDGRKVVPYKKTKDVKSKYNQMIDSLVYTTNDDEYVEDDENTEYKKLDMTEILARDNNEFVDLEDDNNQLDIYEIDDLDKDVQINSNKEVNIEQNIKDYKEHGPSIKAIAFGGTDTHENMTEDKNKTLTCPYCNSPLAGSNGTCPGCGKDVSHIVFEKINIDKIKDVG
jgi:hypothetical protein